MKKLLYFLIFGLGLTAKLHAMDEADVGYPPKSQYEAGQEIREGQQGQTVQEQPRIKIQTSDDQEYEIPKNIAEKSLTIKNMLEDLDEDQDAPIPLPYINANLWDKVYALINIGTIKKLEKALSEESNEDLVAVIPPINYLDIIILDSKANKINLIDLSMKELLARIKKKKLEIDKYVEHFDDYPTNLQTEIVQYFIKKSWLVLQTLEGHKDLVYSVAWSPDGSKLASGSNDKTIRIWDTQSGKLLQRLKKYTGCFFNFGAGHDGWVHSVAWSPDGSKLASGSEDETIKIWDTQSGEVLKTLEGHTGWVYSVAWSPDGSKLASGSSDKTIKIWDAEAGELLQMLEGHGNWVHSVAWSPDGSKLASGSGDAIKIWDTQSGKLLQTLEGHGDWVYSVAWSPDGSTLASGSEDKTIKIWRISLPQQILDIPVSQAYAVIKALEDQKLRDLIILLEEEQLVVLFKAFGGQNLTVDELLILESLPSDLRYFVEAQAGVELLD